MRYVLFILLTLGLYKPVHGQKTQKIIREDKKIDQNCFYHAKYTPDERRKIYPFSVSDTVKLVSYRYHDNNYPVRVNMVIKDSLVEEIILSKSQVNQFTDILTYGTDPTVDDFPRE
jgi:hypothetical protein